MSGRKPTPKAEAKKPAHLTLVADPPSQRAKRPGPGMPPHEPTEKTRADVAAMHGAGIEKQTIAVVMRISRPTLDKYYQVELEAGKAMIDALAVSTLVTAMKSGGKESVSAAKWWTQSRMGWSHNVRVDDARLADTPMRVVVELVGEAITGDETEHVSVRSGFNAAGLVDFAG